MVLAFLSEITNTQNLECENEIRAIWSTKAAFRHVPGMCWGTGTIQWTAFLAVSSFVLSTVPGNKNHFGTLYLGIISEHRYVCEQDFRSLYDAHA